MRKLEKLWAAMVRILARSGMPRCVAVCGRGGRCIRRAAHGDRCWQHRPDRPARVVSPHSQQSALSFDGHIGATE